MEISIPAQEAAFKIDKLLGEGYQLLKDLRNLVYKSHSNNIDPLSKYEITFEDYEYYDMEIGNWGRGAMETLQIIFSSKTALYQFENIGSSLKDNPDQEYHPEGFYFLERLLDSKLKVLSRYYEEISPYSKPVVTFDKEKSILYFGEKQCEIKENTNQGGLCRYLFVSGANIGAPNLFTDVYEYIFGEEPIEKGWQEKIQNAVEAINKKTKKIFGFNILKTEENLAVKVVPSPDS